MGIDTDPPDGDPPDWDDKGSDNGHDHGATKANGGADNGNENGNLTPNKQNPSDDGNDDDEDDWADAKAWTAEDLQSRHLSRISAERIQELCAMPWVELNGTELTGVAGFNDPRYDGYFAPMSWIFDVENPLAGQGTAPLGL